MIDELSDHPNRWFLFILTIRDLKFMKNNLLLTTALVAAAFVSTNAYAARQNVAAGEEAVISSVQSSLGDADTQGGAVLNSGKLTVSDGVSFTGNHGLVGGAVSTVDATDKTAVGHNVSFIGNTSEMQGGAVHNQRAVTTIGNNAKFENNTALGYGGGAVYQDTDGTPAGLTIGDNAVFRNNETKASHGGAVMNFNANESSTVTLGAGAVFENNTAAKNGGAVSNWAGSVALGDDASFIGNHAGMNGGAVHNANYGSSASVDFGNNAVFKNNTADGQGGAVYNDGTLNIKSAVFENNKAAGKLNDIHNTGTVNVSDALTLDGGITGNGTTVFAKDSTLTVKNGTTKISNTVINKGAKLNLILANGYAGGSYSLLADGGSLDNEFTIADNMLYNIEAEENGTYTIGKKTAAEIAAASGISGGEAAGLLALTSGRSADNALFNDVAEDVSALIQSSEAKEKRAGLDSLYALMPETAPVIQENETENFNRVFGAVANRLSGKMGAAGNVAAEDGLFKNSALWAQGLFGKAKYDGHDTAKGFDSDVYGIAVGAEKMINDAVKLGIGYAYGESDIDAFRRDIDVDTNMAMLYGEYKPSDWFVNAIGAYGWSDYSEKKNVAGRRVEADYDVNSLGLRIMTGYDMQYQGYSFTPQGGLRYAHIKQDSYRDSAGQRVSGNSLDITTAVAGVSAGKDFALDNGIMLRPEVRLAAAYDLDSDNVNSAVMLPNGAGYIVNGEKLHRFGLEVGAGLAADITSAVAVSLNYEGSFRKDYHDNTGLLSVMYKF